MVDEIVLINDESPHAIWPHGKITKLIYSSDNKVHSAEVLLPNRCTVTKSINFLYPLEIADSANQLPTNVHQVPDQQELTAGPSPKRYNLRGHSISTSLLICILCTASQQAL